MEDALYTSHLVLRRPQLSDADAIVRALNDAEVSKWLTQVPYPYGHADAVAFINGQTNAPTLLICQNDTPIGCIGTRGEFGYWLGHAYWGQGIMSEASQAVLDWHFETAATPLQSGHAIGNDRSRRVLLKMGFEDTGIVDRRHQMTGALRRQQVITLTHTQWTNRA
ncbi:MAG: GNAT family N-acetyltransferase [Pseudomonadota bacterium]